jgi:peptidoglycan/xylan/chitin deacetylase (PgdA/CDA1 family)
MDVVVLCYHALSRRWECPLAVAPEALARQVSFFLRRGFVATTFTRAVLDPPAPRTLAVTFDDAFASVAEHGRDALGELRAPATVFAPTEFMAGGRLLAWPGIEQWLDGEHAGELRALSWEGLGELAEAGWEIGSHSRTHPRLTRLPDGELREELAGSRAQLQAALGRPCEAIAYPYGDVDERVAAAAGAAGYRAGASLSRDLRPRGPLRQPRVGIYRVDRWWRFCAKAARPARALRASPLLAGRAG